MEADKECLEQIQMRAVRMVSGLTHNTYLERLQELRMETLEERRHRTDMAQVFKIVTRKDNVSSETWFTMATDEQRRTRGAIHPLSLRGQRVRLDIRKNFFSQRVIDSWNAVPAVIKDTATINSFKRLYGAYRNNVDLAT